jgi:CHAT domain-containing protein
VKRFPQASPGRTRRRLLLYAVLAWTVLAIPGLFAAGNADLDRCRREFAVHPEERESARCFWLAGKAGDQPAAARAAGDLLRRNPENAGLLLYSTLLQSSRSPRDEWPLRDAAGRFSGRDETGEYLARYNLVQELLTQGRIDEGSFELDRAAAAAARSTSRSRANYLASIQAVRARLLFNRGDLRQSGELLDEVPPGPLRDNDWLIIAYNVHLEIGQVERSWDECRQLSAAPPANHFARAKGFYCQVRVLLSRSNELPSDTAKRLIEQAAQQAVAEAAAAGDRGVEVKARWTLMMLARSDDEAAAQLPGCLAVAGEGPDRRLCIRALAGRLAAAGKPPPPDVRQALDALALDDPVTRAQEYGDRMRVSWATRPFGDFLQDARQALAGVEELRSRQTAPEVRMGLFSTWSDDYYWFAGRLLESARLRQCPSCIDAAFDATERLRARGLAEELGGGSTAAAAAPDPARLQALAAERLHVLERQADSSLPRCEIDHATADLARLRAEEARLRQSSAAADRGGLARTGLTAGPGNLLPAGDSMSPADSPRAANATHPVPLGAVTRPLSADATVPLATVEALLQRNEALLSFQIAPWTNWSGDFGGGSWLVVATRGARRSYQLAGAGRGALRDEVAEFLQTQDEGDRRRLAATLYAQLLRKALAELPAGIDRLIVVPDDDLHRLPFAALRAAAGESPLVCRYQIAVVPSATLWARWRTTPPPPPAARPALVLADPPPPSPAVLAAFHGEGIELPAAALPGARREARDVLRYLGWSSERRIGTEVSAAALLRPPDRLRQFALVHFATHSIVDERDPERSGIWLAPAPGFRGLLQAPAIAGLRCDGRLVVLSTCSGNGGPLLHGEGVMSLARAFFEAHARTVVASLWPIADDDAETLLRGFYRHLGQGASVAAALREAQVERLRDAPSTPTAAWAGLVVLGDGDLVPFPGGRRPWTPIWLALGAGVLFVCACGIAIRRRLRR